MIRKRSVAIRGHRTSFSVEDAFFDELLRLAETRGAPLARLVAEIDAARPEGTNLSSAVRLHVLEALCAERDAAAAGAPSRADAP